jgi:hypothetical protein
VTGLWEAAQAGQELLAATPEFRPGNLEAKFVAPPFSVLDTRQGYWQDRRRSWLSLGIRSELGRSEDLLALSPAEQARQRWRSGEGRELVAGHGNARTDYGAYQANEEEGAQGGTSIFDPVLCELMYRWFAPEGGLVLDPFAGGSVRGIVAAKLGHPYTGVDLSGRQLEANRGQAAAILSPEEPQPTWLEGDSVHLEELLPAGQMYDMVLTCPPYFDLEVYSDDPADLSNAGEYDQFLEGYGQVIARAAARLLPERFAVLVVSEIRDPAGYCRGFVPDTILAARAAGLHLYNEAVLVNSAGSLPLRVTKYMEASRKLGRAHQNVLVFVKGKPPRGWSWDRTPPPSPQLGLGLEPEPATPAPAAGPPAKAEPAVAPVPVLELEADPGPSERFREYCVVCGSSDHHGDEHHEAVREAQCQRNRYCGLGAGHASGCLLEAPDELLPVRTDEGYLADPATGEVLEAPAPITWPAATVAADQELVSSPGWCCTGCGGEAAGPLRPTIMPSVRRGECPRCGRDKPFQEVS